MAIKDFFKKLNPNYKYNLLKKEFEDYKKEARKDMLNIETECRNSLISLKSELISEFANTISNLPISNIEKAISTIDKDLSTILLELADNSIINLSQDSALSDSLLTNAELINETNNINHLSAKMLLNDIEDSMKIDNLSKDVASNLLESANMSIDIESIKSSKDSKTITKPNK